MGRLIHIAFVVLMITVLGLACGGKEVEYEGPDYVEPQSELEQQQQQQTNQMMEMQRRIREQAGSGAQPANP